MKQIQEIVTEHGRIEIIIAEDYVMLTGYRGKDMILSVPEQIEDKPVTVIGKKAFLGAKGLQELFLPRSITTIQDWAFASCSRLEKIALPRKKLVIGQGILKDCVKLEQIVIAEEAAEGFSEEEAVSEKTASDEDVSYLLGAVMNKLDAFYLFDTVAAGSRQWLEQWDARMLSLMAKEDAEGFSKMLLCGEEDYGSKENNLEYYMEQRRRFKVRLAMLRLMHDAGLQEEVREGLLAYLQQHTKGECSEETWNVVLEEHGDDRKYYQFLLDSGCITKDNFDAVLTDMGEQHTEMKAFLMKERGAQIGEDAFAGLELAW